VLGDFSAQLCRRMKKGNSKLLMSFGNESREPSQDFGGLILIDIREKGLQVQLMILTYLYFRTFWNRNVSLLDPDWIVNCLEPTLL